eukprot:COSAG05_NODE_1426_length_4919_cov_280.452075_6_plen_69_part_00
MARRRRLLRVPPQPDHRGLFLVAHPHFPRKTARPPPIATEEAHGRGRGLPMPREGLRAVFEGLGNGYM